MKFYTLKDVYLDIYEFEEWHILHYNLKDSDKKSFCYNFLKMYLNNFDEEKKN